MRTARVVIAADYRRRHGGDCGGADNATAAAGDANRAAARLPGSARTEFGLRTRHIQQITARSIVLSTSSNISIMSINREKMNWYFFQQRPSSASANPTNGTFPPTCALKMYSGYDLNLMYSVTYEIDRGVKTDSKFNYRDYFLIDYM